MHSAFWPSGGGRRVSLKKTLPPVRVRILQCRFRVCFSLESAAALRQQSPLCPAAVADDLLLPVFDSPTHTDLAQRPCLKKKNQILN